MNTTVHRVDDYRGVEGVTAYEVRDLDGRAVPGPRVAILGQMHGNEPVGRFAVQRLAEVAQRELTAGSVVTALANLEAMRANLRHTADGRDMNRLWDRDSLDRLLAADPATLCYEERRVRELAPVLLDCEVVLDLHSTSRPSPPHLIFRDDLRHAELAARLGVRRLVTGVHEGGILEGGLGADVGLRPGERSSKIGITLEAGQHTNPDNADRAWGVVVRLLSELGMWRNPPSPWSGDYEVYEIIDRFQQAPSGTDPYRFVGWSGDATTAGPEARKLESFEPVHADEVLLRRGSREVVRAEARFTMVMPAPTAGPGEDLFYYTQRRHTNLATRPRTDDAARAEALAIQRTLDLLTDDEDERGVTKVSFNSRRTLDLCAKLIARTRRLPPGHPHRRVTIVGRGDWGGSEAEVRAGRRYQQAVRRALADEVPIDRHQLLRGASFGWLRHLTSAHLGRADDTGGMRLFLSTRQPHTISMLVVGDPDRALADGNLRHVGVALVIEAATVEPSGATVRTRIARAGLFGARRELVVSAWNLVRQLRAEHAHLLQSGWLSSFGSLQGLTDTQGALVPRSEGQVASLREVLYAAQLDIWRRALRPEVVRPLRFDDPRAVGRWLSHTMAATGVLDGHALRHMLVRPTSDGQGWDVDPARLDTAPDRARLGEEVRLVRRIPPQVLEAGDVDRDNVERWIGWVRFLREAQQIPGARGKDLDLAFDTRQIHTRLASWYDTARTLAAREPGRWMLVVAGDGLRTQPAPPVATARVEEAHRLAVEDGNLRYLRIQHAPGTSLSWLKDLVAQFGRRDPSGEPVAMCWEIEHGGTVNVVLLAHRETEAATDPWSLDDWRIDRAAVVVADLERSHRGDDRVALFTEPDDGGHVHVELLHFARTHCDGLLNQARWRILGRAGPAVQVSVVNAIRALVAGWVASAREHRADLERLAPEARLDGLQRRVGVRDRALALALIDEVRTADPPSEAAHRVWARFLGTPPAGGARPTPWSGGSGQVGRA